MRFTSFVSAALFALTAALGASAAPFRIAGSNVDIETVTQGSAILADVGAFAKAMGKAVPSGLKTVNVKGKVFADVNVLAAAFGAKVAKSGGVYVVGNVNVVQGTTQLDGENAKVGQTFTLGVKNPLNFTLRGAEYVTSRFVVGKTVYVPKADEKLLLLHFTVHNPQQRDVRYYWADLNFTAVDALDRNREAITAVVREGTTESLAIQLKPAQKVDVVAAIRVPAAGVVPKLIVSREANAPVLRYDLRGVTKGLPAPFADPADPSGATLLAQVPAPQGSFVPMGSLDVRLDEVKFTSDALGGKTPKAGHRYLSAIFTLKNASPVDARYVWSDFKTSLKDADGERVPYNQKLLKASRDESTQGQLPSGEEVRVRFFFELPENVAGDTLYLTGGEGRTYAFDVKNAK